MKANAHSALSNREIGDIWDEEFEKLLKNDQTTNTVPVDLPPEAKAAGEALNQIFGAITNSTPIFPSIRSIHWLCHTS